MSYNDQYRGKDRDRYSPSYNSSRYPSSDPRRSNSSSSSHDRRSEIPCRFGIKCRNGSCPYRHDSSPPQQHRDAFDRRATIPCRHGMNCTRPHCPYKHESETSRLSPKPSNFSYLNSADDDRTSNSIGSRFEPPPLVPTVRELPPEQSTLHTSYSNLKQEFGKRFEPPCNRPKLQSSNEVGRVLSISNYASAGESQRRRLSFIPPIKSQEILDEKQSELKQESVPNASAATDTDGLAERQQSTSMTKTASVDTKKIKTDNDKCDNISEYKTIEGEMLSSADIGDKDSQHSKRIEANNDITDNSNVESQPSPFEQQQIPTPVHSNNGKSPKCDNIPKPKSVQKVINSLPTVYGTARKAEPKPTCAENEKVRVASQSTSTLANLLSSQRRSAAQLQRYRLQQARPFENIQHDFPIISTVPKNAPSNETLNRSQLSSRLQDDVINLEKKNLTKFVHKNDERVSNIGIKVITTGSKESNAPLSVAKEKKAHTISTKKRKADDMKSTTAVETHIAAASAAVPAKQRKKNKGISPFRVKVGSVVSVRFRPLSEGGNPDVVQVVKDDEQSSKAEQSKNGNPKSFEVWSEPIAGRHDGLSLLGSRIKCVFTKSFVEKWSKKNANFAAGSLHNSVEGNIVSILESDDDEHDSGIVVGLLVDREKIKSLPYLEVISDDASSSSKLALKKIEDIIRGEKNVVVKVVLASVMDKRKGTKLDRSVVKQWVVRKRLLAQPSGKKPSKSERKAKHLKKQSLFIGDGNDKSQQQEKNWRWVAARAISVNSTNESNSIELASQLVGQVTAMIVHEDPGKWGSLATVTIRRMWTPEQTKNGRLCAHGDLELFDDDYGEVHFQAPIEDLVVIGKSVSRQLEVGELSSNTNERKFHITHSYSASGGTYKLLFGGVCDCRLCNPSNVESTVGAIPFLPPLDNIDNQYTADESISSLVTSIMETVDPVNFTLPNNFGSVAMRPSFGPNTGFMKSGLYSEAKSIGEDETSQPRGNNEKRKRKKRVKSVHLDNNTYLEDEKNAVKFKPTCSRTIPFDDILSDFWYLRNKKSTSAGGRRDPSTREIARPRSIESKTKEEVSTLLSGRAARASQRRMVKSLGTASTGVDRLAGRDREQHLRFGKSTIEGWGVFAEEPINAGDLIIEYRGELIGHAVADKREREYEDANIPDYMFRIDAYTVCDATRLGNVARFINASCSPNCYTQIITANENKRIVIYAKRNIARGEELCYDYKFPIEMDPAKRIPCGCGSIECRGYMNWDKRWDRINNNTKTTTQCTQTMQN